MTWAEAWVFPPLSPLQSSVGLEGWQLAGGAVRVEILCCLVCMEGGMQAFQEQVCSLGTLVCFLRSVKMYDFQVLSGALQVIG